MGAQSSKSAPDTALLQRVEKLQICAEEDERTEDPAQNEKQHPLADREPGGLSVQLMESWQSSFLKEPKNRCEISFLGVLFNGNDINELADWLSQP